MTDHTSPFLRHLRTADFLKPTTQFTLFPLDVKTMMESSRRNMRAFSMAQQLALESLQVISQRQSSMASDIAAECSNLLRESMDSGKPEDKISDQSLIIKQIYEKTVDHMRELSDLINQSSQETADVMNKRIAASLAELSDAVSRAKSRGKAAA
jgi:phasin family protein